MNLLLIFEEDEFAEMFSNFRLLGLLVGQLSQVMNSDLSIASCNSLDQQKPVIACWTTIQRMLIQVLKTLRVLFVHHFQHSSCESR